MIQAGSARRGRHGGCVMDGGSEPVARFASLVACRAGSSRAVPAVALPRRVFVLILVHVRNSRCKGNDGRRVRCHNDGRDGLPGCSAI